MTVNTAKVQGRRKLHFDDYEQILAEAESLAAARSVRALGNWSLGKTFQHLASAMRLSLDGGQVKAPFLARWLGPLLKTFFLNRPMPAGFRLSKQAAKELIAEGDVELSEGLTQLRTQLARLRGATEFQPHPVFGRMTAEQVRKLHCRHSELHFSFYVAE